LVVVARAQTGAARLRPRAGTCAGAARARVAYSHRRARIAALVANVIVIVTFTSATIFARGTLGQQTARGVSASCASTSLLGRHHYSFLRRSVRAALAARCSRPRPMWAACVALVNEPEGAAPCDPGAPAIDGAVYRRADAKSDAAGKPQLGAGPGMLGDVLAGRCRGEGIRIPAPAAGQVPMSVHWVGRRQHY